MFSTDHLGPDLGHSLTLSLPKAIMETSSAVLAFKSVGEILWCDHSNETSLTVLSHGVICFLSILRNKIGFWALLGIKWANFCQSKTKIINVQ